MLFVLKDFVAFDLDRPVHIFDDPGGKQVCTLLEGSTHLLETRHQDIEASIGVFRIRANRPPSEYS